MMISDGGHRLVGRFVLTGILNTAVSLTTIAALLVVLETSHFTANAVGLAAGLITGFTLNRHWVFAHRGDLLPTAARYIAAFSLSYVLNAAILTLSLRALDLPPLLAQGIALGSYSLAFFLACRWFVFPNIPAGNAGS